MWVTHIDLDRGVEPRDWPVVIPASFIGESPISSSLALQAWVFLRKQASGDGTF